MGIADVKMNRWLSDNGRFADFVNGALFGGKPVFSKEELEDERNEKQLIVKSKDGREQPLKRYRDIEKRTKGGTRIVVLACENQTNVHYGMVVRNMLYDSLNYAQQIEEKKRSYRGKKERVNPDEFLSGLKKDDLLKPVITIVFYYGEKEDGWDGKVTLHGLTGMEREEYKILKKYVPNYHINVINLKDLEDFSCPNRDLQMIFGMLKYRQDKEELHRYVMKNQAYFEEMDRESYDAALIMLGKKQLLGKPRQKEEERSMCKALDDLYQDGVMEGKKAGLAEGERVGRKAGLAEGKRAGIAEGKCTGALEGRAECIVEVLQEKGNVPDNVRNRVFAEKNMETLREWLRIAVRAENVAAFEMALAS